MRLDDPDSTHQAPPLYATVDQLTDAV
ncbi:hypothetical protein [Streptomyces sp. NPDC058371]